MWGTRPTASRISAPSTLVPSLSSATTPAPPARLLGLDAGADVDAEALRAAPRRPLRRRTASSRASRCPLPSTRVTLVPSEDQAWDSSQPTGPPPSTIMLSGTRFAVVALAVVPGLDRVEAVDRRHRRAAAGGDDHGRAGGQQVVADEDPSLAVEPRRRRGRGRFPFFEPGQLAGVVAVVDDLVAAVEDRRRVEPTRHRPPRPGCAVPRRARRPVAAAPSRACRRSRNIRRRSGAARRSRPSSRRRLGGRRRPLRRGPRRPRSRRMHCSLTGSPSPTPTPYN